MVSGDTAHGVAIDDSTGPVMTLAQAEDTHAGGISQFHGMPYAYVSVSDIFSSSIILLLVSIIEGLSAFREWGISQFDGQWRHCPWRSVAI